MILSLSLSLTVFLTTFSLALFLHNLPFCRKERVCSGSRYQGDVTREKQQQQQLRPQPWAEESQGRKGGGGRGEGYTRGAQGAAINSLLLPRNCQGSYSVARTRAWAVQFASVIPPILLEWVWVGASMRRMWKIAPWEWENLPPLNASVLKRQSCVTRDPFLLSLRIARTSESPFLSNLFTALRLVDWNESWFWKGEMVRSFYTEQLVWFDGLVHNIYTTK